MFHNSYKLLFFFSLIFGTILSISSLSWFNSWMGLEINLLSFIPLIMKNKLNLIETCTKYFLTQTLASNILLFSIILSSFFSMKFIFFYYYFNLLNFFIFLTLLMKIGSAPFHIWFIQVSSKLNWQNNFILMTWQKIAPLILISYCHLNFFIFSLLSLYSIFIGTMGGLNQICLRKLMAYSSINHLGWILLNIMINMNNFKLYFLIYILLSFTVIFMFLLMKSFFMKQLYTKNLLISIKFFLNFPILSLAGLPPLMGFFPKWMSLELLINSNLLFLSFFITYFSLFSIFFYMRISYNFIFLNHFEIKNFIFKKNNFIFFFFFFLFSSIFSLFFMNFMFFF
uniref:NADH dehydrogenase subunit 2 n=1 Tax=Stenochironomus zhengi TaxID=2916445 RepID=UPI001FAF40CE|nr:NADH dehydrogenase subunit 2 [Stenochironomus zhengi]UKO33046.1 NADH dehydrogenase subunit 2 [Stenochironomus zhengi]